MKVKRIRAKLVKKCSLCGSYAGLIFKQDKAKGLLMPPLRFTSDGNADRKRRV